MSRGQETAPTGQGSLGSPQSLGPQNPFPSSQGLDKWGPLCGRSTCGSGLLTATFLCALILLLASCAALRPRPKDPGLFLLPPAGAGFSRTLHQAITVHRGPHALEATVVAELTPTSDRFVALGPFGNRVLTLLWDGAHLEQERDPSLPKDFPAELVLRDLQLAYWTPEAVRAGLPSGWTLAVGPHDRTLTNEGDVVIAIHFAGDPFKDSIDFEHRTLGYQLHIEQVNDTP